MVEQLDKSGTATERDDRDEPDLGPQDASHFPASRDHAQIRSLQGHMFANGLQKSPARMPSASGPMPRNP